MPPAAVVQRALRVTTERLARELDEPSAQPPDWNEFEWRVAMAVSVMHGLSALLASRLRWRGPQTWTSFLAEQQQQGHLRQQRTRQLLAGIHSAALEAHIPLVALKGSALLDLELYAPGERPMSDIDLLCLEQDFEATGRLIEGLDYVEGTTIWRHREYLPGDAAKERAFGEHIGNPIKIELHGRILERLTPHEIDITAQVFPRRAHAGLNVYPSLAALLRHLLLHAAGNMYWQIVRLIHLHDIAALADRLHPGDWEEVLQGEPDGQVAWWALPPLAMADRYFPGRIPAAVLSKAALQCPPLLRWASRRAQIAGVSLSRLKTPMFPGLTWSLSMSDALASAVTRLYPGREAIASAQHAAFNIHALAASNWLRQSRWLRGLRVVAGGAPRAMTMYSVRRALDYLPEATSSPYIASIREQV